MCNIKGDAILFQEDILGFRLPCSSARGYVGEHGGEGDREEAQGRFMQLPFLLGEGERID